MRRAKMRTTKQASASPGSPGWMSAKDMFKSPKSPSPVASRTRRTSVYQPRGAVNSNPFDFRRPPGLKSPPGVKTRATRRSSIYQRRGGQLVSPPKTRTRRTSMYVGNKNKSEQAEFFSKVWATPVRKPEPIQELTDAKVSVRGSPNKSVTPAKKQAKTPKSATKSTSKSQNTSKVTKTPIEIKEPVPSPVKLRAKKTPGKSVSQASSAKPPMPKKNSPGSKSSSKKKTPPKMKLAVITSTPTKSLEDITGKSFYGTPGETPIQNRRTDEVFIFSAIKSAKKSAKKAQFSTPPSTPVKESVQKMPTTKTPAVNKITSDKKTPAVKRKRNSTGGESVPVAKKSRQSPAVTPTEKRLIKSARRTAKSPSGTPAEKRVVKSAKKTAKSPPETPAEKRVVKSAKNTAKSPPETPAEKRVVKSAKSPSETPAVKRVVKSAKKTAKSPPETPAEKRV
ncbi:hypothetical protein MAR_015425, partial [Mya arenaria]